MTNPRMDEKFLTAGHNQVLPLLESCCRQKTGDDPALHCPEAGKCSRWFSLKDPFNPKHDQMIPRELKRFAAAKQ